MNSAPGTKHDNAADYPDQVDRDLNDGRRHMKLVPGRGVGKAFTIEVADDVFAPFARSNHSVTALQEGFRNSDAKDAKFSDAPLCDSDRSSSMTTSGRIPGVLVTAAIAGLILGYLSGAARPAKFHGASKLESSKEKLSGSSVLF